MTDDRDPAVDTWAEALAALRGVAGKAPFKPDRRTPFEVERDNALEDRAEARADYRSYDYDGSADEAADRYHEMGNE